MFRYAHKEVLLSTVAAIAAVSAGIALWWDSLSGPIGWNSFELWVKLLGAGGTPAAITLLIFEKWAWRWPGVCLLMKVPRIEGTWVGDECSDTFRPKQAGKRRELRRVVVKIEQSPMSISYVAHNGPTINHGIATSFDEIGDSNVFRLCVTYRNDPTGKPASENTREHFGTCLLILSNGKRQPQQSTLDGTYWTRKLRVANDEYSAGTAGKLMLFLYREKPTLFSPSDLKEQYPPAKIAEGASDEMKREPRWQA
jgi:hypothetical protein